MMERASALRIGMLLTFMGVTLAGCGPGNTSPNPAADVGVDADPPSLIDPTGFFTDDELRELEEFAPLAEVPPDPTNKYADNEKAVKFGQFLFYDERFSGNGKVSCASCHDPEHGFSDPKKLSEGMGTTGRHAPTLLNTSYNRWYFWDGRADSTWAQIHSPMEAPNEQGISRVEIAHVIYDDTELKKAYESIFGKLPDLSDDMRFPEAGRPIPDRPEKDEHKKWTSMSEKDRKKINRVMANVAKAIAAFERKLVSREAPFDEFMRGLKDGDKSKVDALSKSQKRGLRLFIGKADCNECHMGAFFSDLEFHNLGLPQKPWLKPMDQGRYEGVPVVKNDVFNAAGPFSDAPDSRSADEIKFLIQKDENRGQFKTPTLRNVERTDPYMHGGHFESLQEVVEFYAELDNQVLVGHREESLEKFDLSDSETDDLVAFLKALSGESVPEKLKKQPDSPR